jgi:hypothetical protein
VGPLRDTSARLAWRAAYRTARELRAGPARSELSRRALDPVADHGRIDDEHRQPDGPPLARLLDRQDDQQGCRDEQPADLPRHEQLISRRDMRGG